MQGIVIVSATVAVRESLAMMLRDGRTVRQCRSMSECLSLAAAEKLDFIFVDDVFDDGTAEDLVSRLHGLGYGIEIIPIVLSLDEVHQRRFRPYGVRNCIAKPFNLRAVNTVLDQIEELQRLRQTAVAAAPQAGVPAIPEPGTGDATETGGDVEAAVFEVSQRFRRLLAHLQNRAELVRTFADALREHFDLDNVVVLLPAAGRPVFVVEHGTIAEDVKEQFFIPMSEPLVQGLVRLGEPVRVSDAERLGRDNAASATRYGERLNAHLLCPVLCHGQLRAIAALSRCHRYPEGQPLVRILRPFLTFFGEALENCDDYEHLSQTGQTLTAVFDALGSGVLAVGANGRIRCINACAARILNVRREDVSNQPVERAGSVVAHCARTTLESNTDSPTHSLAIQGAVYEISAAPMPLPDDAAGALVQISPAAADDDDALPSAPGDNRNERLWIEMATTIAHNFKNAFVPLQVCAEMLPEHYAEENFRQFYVQTVGDSIDSLCQWIDQLLGFATFNEEQEWGTLQVEDVVEKAVARVRTKQPDSPVAIVVEPGPEATVEGNHTILEQAIVELVGNAVDAAGTNAAPQVTVSWQTTEGNLQLDVRDNGDGMNNDTVANAFKPFVSNHPTGRLGLGLAYVQKAVERHGGSAAIESEEDTGTCVSVILPLTRQEAVAAAAED